MDINRMLRIVVLTVLAFTAAAAARANSFDVSLNTSALSGTTQIIAFGLTNNDGSTDNTITLNGFDFAGGSAVSGSEDCTLGGALSGVGCSGNLATGITLTDTADEVFFTEQFNVGSSLSFALTTTNNFAGGIPDGFAIYVCDATLSACYSDDLSTSAMLVLGLTGANLSPSSFTLNGASAQGLPAPVVTVPLGGSTPEPSTLLLLTIGVLTLASIHYRRRNTPNVTGAW